MSEVKGEASKYEKLFSTAKEHPESYEAEIAGFIPKWVKGTLLKNGPGLMEVGPDAYHHWFDGLALIHRFHVHDGKVEYSSKYLRSQAYERNMAAQRIVVGEFGTLASPDPCKNIFERYFAYFFPTQLTDNDVVNFIQCGDEVYATTETTILNKIDPKTLEVQQNVKMGTFVAANTATAHPHYTDKGEVLNMGSGNTEYKIIKVPSTKEAVQDSVFEKSVVVGNIPMSSWRNPSYYHSFGMTQRYIIFPEMPLHMSLLSLATAQLMRRPMSESMYWNKDEQTKMHIFDMEKGVMNPLIYVAPTFFRFHHANSFEKDGCLVADMVCFKDGSVIKSISLENMRKGMFSNADNNPHLWRFIIPLTMPQDANIGANLLLGKGLGQATATLLADGRIELKPEIMTEKSFEFPRYNYNYNGKEYQYLYGTGAPEDVNDILGHCVYKFDLVSGTVVNWSRDHEDQYASEPVFVPKPGAEREDEGVLLVAVTNVKEEERPFLLVLDAQTMAEHGRAMIKSDLPPGFHSHFVAHPSVGCFVMFGVMYISEKRVILGRTARSWVEIILFYVVFYLGAGGMFAALLFGFMHTQSKYQPAFFGHGSLNAIPGVSVRPNPIYLGSMYTTIHFNGSLADTYNSLVQQLRDELDHYKHPNDAYFQMPCNASNYPRMADGEKKFNVNSKVCVVDITDNNETGLGLCGCKSNQVCSNQTFGYPENEPCLMLRINNVMNWYPEMWPETSDVPAIVAGDYDAFFKSKAFWKGQNSDDFSCWHRRVFIKCMGKSTEDREHESNNTFEYFPKHGIPFCYFPFVGQLHYQRPIIMVKVKNLPPSRAMNLLCTIYSKNVEPFSQGQEQVGENEIPLMVESRG